MVPIFVTKWDVEEIWRKNEEEAIRKALLEKLNVLLLSSGVDITDGSAWLMQAELTKTSGPVTGRRHRGTECLKGAAEMQQKRKG